MICFTITPDMESPLLAAAKRQGKTPEQLALDNLRNTLLPIQPPNLGSTRYDALKDCIGQVEGHGTAWPDNVSR